MTNYRLLAELQERLRDERFVNVLHELAERGTEPERSFANLLLRVAESRNLISGGDDR